MKKLLNELKVLNFRSKKLIGLIIVLFLAIALPFFAWAVLTQRLDLRKRASSGEQSICVAVNKTISLTPSGGQGTCHDFQTAIDAVDGPDFVINVGQGQYDVHQTIRIENKTNLTITGDPQIGAGAFVVNFVDYGGWGFLINSSSVYLDYLNIQGISSNGMVSFGHSDNSGIRHSSVFSRSSHTIDVGSSSNFIIHDSEIRSSAGALEISGVSDVKILNNTFPQSANAISINNSGNVDIEYNTIAGNTESGIRTYNNVGDINIYHNSIINNASSGNGIPAVYIREESAKTIDFNNNIIAYNPGPGVKFENSNITFDPLRNIFWKNSAGNFVGTDNFIGQNGNIEENPLIYFGEEVPKYCLLAGSPAIYGNVSSEEYMGSKPPCGNFIPSKNSINWVTPDVSISADDFYVLSRGKVYFGNNSNTNIIPGTIDTNPGTVHWANIEIQNNQYEDNLRMKIYFKEEGSAWSVYSVGVLNSNLSDNWITYTGPFGYTPIGQAYNKDIKDQYTLIDPVSGRIVADVFFENLKIQAFTNSSPNPTDISSTLSGEPSIGPSDAPVTIVEFTDFQCPFCKTFYSQETLKSILEMYGNQVRFVSKDFPLPGHGQAESAAEAAQCAFEQGKFWEMHDLLFDNQDSLSQTLYFQLATTLNLDVQKFEECMNSHTYLSEISEDKAQGEFFGVSGTPTFFINNEKVVGAVGFSSFKSKIDAILGIEGPSPSPYKVPGDVNGDGHVNIVDIGIVTDHYRTTPPGDPRADLNNDGTVNIVDVGIIVDNYGI